MMSPPWTGAGRSISAAAFAVDEDMIFVSELCGGGGGENADAAVMTKTHSVTIGYLLWIFGFTGAHRFYYGKPVSGVVWFLTLGLLGVGWLVDAFLIPGMDRKADARFTTGRYDYSVAWILQTFLGLFGIHRFYLGKVISGLVWLFTGGLLGIGWLVDFCTLNEQVDERNRETA